MQCYSTALFLGSNRQEAGALLEHKIARHHSQTGPASRKGIGDDLNPNPETTARSPHRGLDTELSTPATARTGSNPPEEQLCRAPLSSYLPREVVVPAHR